MTEPQLDTHPDLSIEVRHIGNEGTPLLVIDNLVDQPEAIIDYAAACTLERPGDMYPGVRAPAPASYLGVLRKALTGVINEAYGLADMTLHNAKSYMSIVTTQPQDLKPVQCIPHIDSTTAHSYASVHYLCSEKFRGTSLYRHRATGYEVVPDYRHARFRSILDEEMRQSSWSARDYIEGDTDLFERIASVEVRFNRAVLYPATALHAIDIGEGFRFDPDPRTGRFSVNTRIQMQAKAKQSSPWFTPGGARG